MAHIKDEDMERWFTHHPPKGDDAERYLQLRESGWKFASDIRALTPTGADQSAAIRKVREAVMTANAAIACRERD